MVLGILGTFLITSPGFVVEAACCSAFGGIVGAGGGVGFVGWRGIGEVAVYGGALVGGLRVDVAEAAAGGESSDGDLVVALCLSAGREVGGAESGHIGTAGGKVCSLIVSMVCCGHYSLAIASVPGLKTSPLPKQPSALPSSVPPRDTLNNQ